MSRVWYEVISPKQLHDQFGVYHGIWMPQMDRCWSSDDGFQVMSRIIMTKWGKVEHATISIESNDHRLSSNGERDIPWAVKQEIKNELFGPKRLAIEVFPKDKSLVNVQDCYHLWVFPKEFDLPFGIHPTRDPQCKPVSRGCLPITEQLIKNTERYAAGEWIKEKT